EIAFEDLTTGQLVEVRGVYDDQDTLLATRIEEKETGPTPNGMAVGGGAGSFHILGTPRASFSAVTVDDRVVFVGGFGRLGPLDLVQMLHPDGQLSDLPALPEARGGLAAVALGDSIIALGGRITTDRALDDVLVLDLSGGGAWEPMPRMNEARTSAAAVRVGGTLYVIGGRNATGRVLDTVESLTLSDTNDAADDQPTRHRLRLGQNYPNPFSGTTTITFSVPTTSSQAPVHLAIYDLQGRHVATLVRGTLPPGTHQVRWDGRTSAGNPVSSGVYFYRLQHEGRTVHAMMTLVR
ncbi:MAG: T9SS type A sorting domain-containing protein, partial [Bacteroidetes bacterium]|nr:T9SS type A sorting domain-containing protein [Bacteroidota bacterium]